jgi:hypothetical protein
LGKVTVHQFTKYDITTDTSRKSRRWATREAISRVRGEVLEEVATVIDEAALNRDEPGMTDMAFDPHAFSGLQRMV